MEDNVETIQIESSLVGLIIGRQGENLRRVENDTGARVQFITGPEMSGPRRSCKITGSRQARNDAKTEIYRIIEENGRATGASALQLDQSARSGSHQPALRDGEDSMQIMVPDRTVGLIIGRGGETIRDLQDRSKCHVNIVGESKSVNGLRPVNLIGSPQAAAKAKELIMEIVESDTRNLANQGPPAREPARGGGGYGMGGSGSGGGAGGDRINDTIRVPSDAVGMIIGKGKHEAGVNRDDQSTDRFCSGLGGETIKDMENMTGCKINVSQPSGPHEYDREIGLAGSRDAIEQAKRAIEEKVDIVVRPAAEPTNWFGFPDGLYIQQRRGARGQTSDSYNDRPSPGKPSYAQSQASVPQAQVSAPQSGDADPYAAYGGYNNYVAMWYAAMAQQQQQQQLQQGQGQGEQPKPPGTL